MRVSDQFCNESITEKKTWKEREKTDTGGTFFGTGELHKNILIKFWKVYIEWSVLHFNPVLKNDQIIKRSHIEKIFWMITRWSDLEALILNG